jgi:hypothetical protein
MTRSVTRKQEAYEAVALVVQAIENFGTREARSSPPPAALVTTAFACSPSGSRSSSSGLADFATHLVRFQR